jgi:predicted dehydrogenase
VSGQHGHVWLQDFIRPHWGHLVAVRDGSVIADERGGADTSYTEQLRAFAAAIAGAGDVPTSAAHAVVTMRLIDDAYRAAGLLPRGE